MKRMNLEGWTPEQKLARKATQADARKRKQRAKEKEKRDMAKKMAQHSSTSPAVLEFIDELRGLKFRDMIEPIAFWERENKQRLPLDSCILPDPGESRFEPAARKEHHRQLCLATFCSFDYYARQKAAARKKVFDDKQAAEADSLGITVFELQKRRKITASVTAKKARETRRLAEKIAA